MRKPLAVQRRDYINSSGPSIYGIKRTDKVLSPQGHVFIFLGVREGEVYLEREDKSKGEPFQVTGSADFAAWTKQR